MAKVRFYGACWCVCTKNVACIAFHAATTIFALDQSFVGSFTWRDEFFLRHTSRSSRQAKAEPARVTKLELPHRFRMRARFFGTHQMDFSKVRGTLKRARSRELSCLLFKGATAP